MWQHSKAPVALWGRPGLCPHSASPTQSAARTLACPAPAEPGHPRPPAVLTVAFAASGPVLGEVTACQPTPQGGRNTGSTPAAFWCPAPGQDEGRTRERCACRRTGAGPTGVRTWQGGEKAGAGSMGAAGPGEDWPVEPWHYPINVDTFFPQAKLCPSLLKILFMNNCGIPGGHGQTVENGIQPALWTAVRKPLQHHGVFICSGKGRFGARSALHSEHAVWRLVTFRNAMKMAPCSTGRPPV